MKNRTNSVLKKIYFPAITIPIILVFSSFSMLSIGNCQPNNPSNYPLTTQSTYVNDIVPSIPINMDSPFNSSLSVIGEYCNSTSFEGVMPPVTTDGYISGTTVFNEKANIIVEFNAMPAGPYLMDNASADYYMVKHYQEKIISTHNLFKNDLQKNGVEINIRREYTYVFNGIAATVSQKDVEEIRGLPYVKAVYPDQEVQICLDESIPLINADDVWEMQNSTGAYVTGKDIIIAIIDTGIDYTHPDLGGGFGPDYKIVGGYDFVNNDNDPMDDNGHGTHCAGIAAANGTLKGVAPDAKLMAYKVLNFQGYGYDSDVIAGIERACNPDQNPSTDDAVDIISLSLGGSGNPDDPCSQAVDTASDLGVVVVVAAGNRGSDYQTIDSPGCARKVITVGATDKNDTIAYFSSRGPVIGNNIDSILVKPDILAPGVLINSTVPESGEIGSPTGYRQLSGTSMATPHVAGTVSLLLQLHKDWTQEQIKSSLMNTAVDLNYTIYEQGAGRVDAYKTASGKTLVVPYNPSLGLDNLTLDTWSVNRTLQITNLMENQVIYNLSAQLPTEDGIKILLSSINITLNSNETKSFWFNLSVNNSLAPDKDYCGVIFLQSALETLRAPFGFTKSPALQITFSEEPWTVWVHDRVSRRLKYCAYPGKSLFLLTPKGECDVLTSYSGNNTIFESLVMREGINVTNFTLISISQSEAVYTVSFEPLDKDGNRLIESGGYSQELGISLVSVIHVPSGLVNIFGQTGLQLAPVFLSNFTGNYTIEWVQTYNNYTTNDFYVINNYTHGVSDNLTFTNDPNNWKHLKYIYHVDSSVETIFTNHFVVCQGNWGSLASPTYYALSRPFIRNTYYTPIPYPEFFVKYNYVDVHEYVSEHYFGDLIYRAPWLCVKNSTTFEVYLVDCPALVPLYSSAVNEMHVGVSPPHWFGRFENENSMIVLRASKGYLPWLFLTQGQDLRHYDDLLYKLYDQNGMLVQNGTFCDYTEVFILPWEINVASVTPGVYSLRVYNNRYFIGDLQGEAFVNATFNTSAGDKNPPYMVSLNIFSNNTPVDTIEPVNTNEIKFEVKDDTNLSQVSLFYNINGTWAQLPLSNIEGNYSAQIPKLPNSTFVSLKIVANDTTNNTLTYEMNPAFKTPMLDLSVSPLNIMFSPTIPIQGDVVTINTTIYNNGERNISNVLIQFFGGDPNINGTQIGTNQTIDIIPFGECRNTTVTWNTTGLGCYHDIYVIIDPLNIITEINETNNYAFRTIKVNRKPVLINPLPDKAFDEDCSLINAFNLNDYFSDPDDEELTCTASGNNYISVVINDDETVDLQASANWYGNETITLRATDPYDAFAEDTIVVTVNPVNDAPVIIGILPSFDKDEDDLVWVLDLTNNKSDVDNTLSELVWSVSNWDTSLFDSVTVGDNNITFDLKANAYGNNKITIILSDGLLTDGQNIWINVAPVNDPPMIADLTDQLIVEDVTFWYDITPYISDIDNDISDLVVSTNSGYILVHNNNRTVEMNYPNGITVDYVRITVSDGILSDYEDVVFTITPVNDAPVISGIPDQFGVEDIAWTLDVTPYIDDIDNTTEDLMITVNSSYATADGKILTFLYPNGILSENVRITVSDGINTSYHDIMVIVTPVNNPPVIELFTPIDNPIIDEGEEQVFTVSASDIDNTDLTITWYLDDNLVATGSTCIFTSDYTYAGTYTVKTVVSDGSLTDEKTWTLTVNDVKKEEKGFISGFEVIYIVVAIGIIVAAITGVFVVRQRHP